MGAPLAYFEITSTDQARAAEFYRSLFDWSLDGDSMPDYSMVDTGAGEHAVGGGIGAVQEPGGTGGITIYFKVDDLAATLAKAESLGGKTILAPMDLPGDFGKIAVLADLDGNPVGLWA